MLSLSQQHHHQQPPQQQHQTAIQPYSYSPEYNSDYTIDLTRANLDENLALIDQHFPAELMQSDAWAITQQTPRLARFAHQRESSLSSLGSSAAPSSPYAHSTSNPQIAITNAAHDNTNATSGPNHTYYQLSKSYPNYQTCGGIDQAMPEMAYPITISGPGGKPRMDNRGLIPAPDFSTGSTRSHPASVASSIAGDSPATPTVGESDIPQRWRKSFVNVPKLDRTMTDVYADELYSPNFAITSTPPSQPQMAVSPSTDLFSQRLHAANSQHLSAAHSPVSTSSRGRSPFRTGSPLAPSPIHDFGHPMGSNMPFNTAQAMREQSKAQQEAQLHHQMTQRAEPETPKTISPKDAILEFNEPEGDSNFPLFPQDSTNFEMDQFSKVMASQGSQDGHGHDGSSSSQFNYLPSHMPTGIAVPQQYPFVANHRAAHDTPPRLSSAGSSSTASRTNTPTHMGRPTSTTADGGTYTCTYHGCTLRFDTPALLQKHKREGHRQTQTLGGPRIREIGGMTSTMMNTQAGPHRCDRINPSTGKPCNTIFSRPYDLTRHEDTIHNARKQKVRCNLCTEEKTFSRADALTRHYRVCHPDVELPGKHRRRGGA
ncbi:hypothetical protein B0T10DRAFT_193063 [Thelonectria olida]|uniref:C2H2-type domain-containing protein n=1 Tax=Thelonectria olida TaxID=1576542 RepID=A0A9P8VU51_9HYPO|nr:hypothetical protein B0T10DRAFT_193063 [Thelonectria olida]